MRRRATGVARPHRIRVRWWSRDWRETEAALLKARADGTAPTLVTPEDAAAFYGAGYLAALQERARQEFADVDFTLVVDCGDAPGYALACLRAGVKRISMNPLQRQDRRHRPPDGRRAGEETDMSSQEHWQPTRDLLGYGANPPDPKWPNGARVAVNFVMNYEEGSEPSMQDGEGYTETGLTEATSSSMGMKGRDLAGEGMFEYGSRVGFWRLMRAFQERGLPMTVFGCALALERNKLAAEAIRKSGFDVCCHGWRWVKHFELSEAEEREHIAKAVKSLQQTVGARAGRLVLPLWTQRQHPPPAGRGRRLHLRQRLLRRRAAVLADRAGQAAPDRALLAHQQRRQVRHDHEPRRRLVQPGQGRLRRPLQGRRHAARR